MEKMEKEKQTEITILLIELHEGGHLLKVGIDAIPSVNTVEGYELHRFTVNGPFKEIDRLFSVAKKEVLAYSAQKNCKIKNMSILDKK